MENKLSVSQLNNYIKGVFDDELVLQKIYVYGEVYEFSVSNGITYITLKENDCYIHCVKYSRLEKIDIGTTVTLFGSVTFYRKTGRVTFSVLSLQKTGEGKHYLELLELKKKLLSEGLFTNKHKLPDFISSVAIVTSSTGAVIHDFLSVLVQKHPYILVKVFKSKVQGENAVSDLCEALRNADKSACDVIVVARGGGSAADLNCFNDENVVRAIAGLSVPTVSAVGHETDYTLCDLASTERAGTPSIAAGLISDINDKTTSRLELALSRINNAAVGKIRSGHARIYKAITKISVSAGKAVEHYKFRILKATADSRSIVEKRIYKSENYVRETVRYISDRADRAYKQCGDRFSAVLQRIEGNNPFKVLSLGYAKVKKNGEEIVRASQLKNNDEISVRFADGQIMARVTEGRNEI